ncbi:MAG: hypothetical protein ISR97_02575 [Nitrospira sp.]|nr:hypothetical protein [Nitrospira sp.]
MNILKTALSLMISTVIIGSSYGIAAASGSMSSDPASLYETKCSVCHALERSQSKSKSEKSWRKTVLRMKKNGAPITDEEAEIIIRHLADTYGR